MELATGGTLANQIEQATKTLGCDQKPRNWTGVQSDLVSTDGLLVKLDEAREADRRAFDVAMAQ